MQHIKVYDFLVFFIPTLSSAFMLAMLGWNITGISNCDRQPKIWLLCCMASLMFTFLIPITFLFDPGVFAYFNWLHYFAMLSASVFFYYFIFEITRTEASEHFSNFHYVLPSVASLMMFFLFFITPYREQLQAITNRERLPDKYTFYSTAYYSKMILNLLVKAFYTILCFVRLHHYSKFVIHYSSNEYKSSLGWVYRYLWVLLLSFVITILLAIFPNDKFLDSPWTLGSLLMMAILQIYVVYHVLKGHYLLIDNNDTTSEVIQEREQSDILKKSLLTKTYFEEYINKQRPYLNLDLKITDMVDDLQVNRTYISGFINSEYNMNFSQYINQCRLNEYNRMRNDPAWSNKSDEELCALAGFSNYRYFQRLAKKQTKRNDS